MATVCPLGLCRTEEDCPNAPCIECMRRLGDHMIEEVKIVQRQAKAAKLKGDLPAVKFLQGLLSSMGLAVTIQEMVQNAGDPHIPGELDGQAHVKSTQGAA